MLSKFSNGLALLRRRRDLAAALGGMINQRLLSTRQHLGLCADGVLNASRCSTDGGSSVGYSLIHGWHEGYIETTGYMVPTAFDLAARLGRPELAAEALRMGEWLLERQRADGSFPGITREEPEVFDTGQVLIGLTRLARETGDARYEAAARRACDWLCRVQDRDGSWTSHGSPPGRSPTYLTRTAAALADFGGLVGEKAYSDAAHRFLAWAEPRCHPNGLYENSELSPGEPFLLHTMIYVLEGFLRAWETTGERRWLDCVLRGAEPLKRICLEEDIVPRAYYDRDLRPVSSDKCLTGLAQWAGVCLALDRDTDDPAWLECASNALFYLKSKQLQVKGHLRGALSGSIPIWGRYLKWSFPNWGLKFFADALIKLEDTGLDTPAQQQLYVARSHHLNAAKVGWTAASRTLSAFDEAVMARMEAWIGPSLARAGPAPVVVDLGCGTGRCLDWLARRNPGWRLIGVDPLVEPGAGEGLLRGGASSIPLETASVDCLYAMIALQHVDDLDGALAEAARVLRPGGIMVVFDRNPASIRGLLKPWHELRGRWMYDWDSPFRERWRSPGRWRAQLRRAGLEPVRTKVLTSHDGRGLRRLLPINRFIMVEARKKPSSTGPTKAIEGGSRRPDGPGQGV